MQSGLAFYTVYETQGTSSAAASGHRATVDSGAAEARTAPSCETHAPLPQLDLVFAKHDPADGTFEWIPPGLLHNALFDSLEYATQARRVCNPIPVRPSLRTFKDSRKPEMKSPTAWFGCRQLVQSPVLVESGGDAPDSGEYGRFIRQVVG